MKDDNTRLSHILRLHSEDKSLKFLSNERRVVIIGWRRHKTMATKKATTKKAVAKDAEVKAPETKSTFEYDNIFVDDKLLSKPFEVTDKKTGEKTMLQSVTIGMKTGDTMDLRNVVVKASAVRPVMERDADGNKTDKAAGRSSVSFITGTGSDKDWTYTCNAPDVRQEDGTYVKSEVEPLVLTGKDIIDANKAYLAETKAASKAKAKENTWETKPLFTNDKMVSKEFQSKDGSKFRSVKTGIMVEGEPEIRELIVPSAAVKDVMKKDEAGKKTNEPSGRMVVNLTDKTPDGKDWTHNLLAQDEVSVGADGKKAYTPSEKPPIKMTAGEIIASNSEYMKATQAERDAKTAALDNKSQEIEAPESEAEGPVL